MWNSEGNQVESFWVTSNSTITIENSDNKHGTKIGENQEYQDRNNNQNHDQISIQILLSLSTSTSNGRQSCVIEWSKSQRVWTLRERIRRIFGIIWVTYVTLSDGRCHRGAAWTARRWSWRNITTTGWCFERIFRGTTRELQFSWWISLTRPITIALGMLTTPLGNRSHTKTRGSSKFIDLLCHRSGHVTRQGQNTVHTENRQQTHTHAPTAREVNENTWKKNSTVWLTRRGSWLNQVVSLTWGDESLELVREFVLMDCYSKEEMCVFEIAPSVSIMTTTIKIVIPSI